MIKARLAHHVQCRWSKWPRYLCTWLPPIHPRLSRQSRFKPCLRPGYFLLLETRMLLTWVKGPWALVTPINAIKVGEGFKAKRMSGFFLTKLEFNFQYCSFVTLNSPILLKFLRTFLMFICQVSEQPKTGWKVKRCICHWVNFCNWINGQSFRDSVTRCLKCLAIYNNVNWPKALWIFHSRLKRLPNAN